MAGLPGAIAGGLGFILPGLAMTLAIAAVLLGDAPPDWIVGVGAGAGAAVIAVIVQAAIVLGRSTLGGRRDFRGAAYALAAAATVILAGPYVVLVLLGAGCSSSPGAGAPGPRRTPGRSCSRTRHGAAGVAWMAFKVGALSYGGGFVVIPLMQGDAVDRYGWMTDAEFVNAIAFGQLTPARSRTRWRSSAGLRPGRAARWSPLRSRSRRRS